MTESADLARQAIAALGAQHQQLLAALNNPNAPNTLFISSDPKDNDVTLQIDTTIATTLTAGATPVPPDDAPGSTFSLLYLDLTHLNLSDAEFDGITLPDDWLSQKYGRQICLAPKSDQPLSPATGAGLGVKLPGFTMANPPPGTDACLTLTYFNVAGITVADLGTSHRFKVLFQRPPDAKDRDLHADLLLTLAQPLVACSLQGYDPVSNTLSMIFQPNPSGGPAIAGPTSLFEVTFVYADNPPGYGALCAAADITGPVRGTNAGNWSLEAGGDKANPSWLLGPPAGKPIVGSGAAATVSFDFDSIVTWLDPGPTLMLVTYSNIPGYRDGSFQVPIVKVAHPDIESISATPNPAQLENPAGVDVVIDWTVHDAGKLILVSSAGLYQPVTGRGFWKVTGVTSTTKFTLEADGKFLADMGNTATKSIDAVVTPHIEFSGTILPDHSGVQLTWNIIGAFYAQLEGSFDLLEPQGHTPPIPLGPTNPLPYSFTIKALDQNRKELARITVKRCWKAGSPISVGGNAASIAAVSPDGKRLYAFSGKSDSVSISIFDAVTLNPLATIPAGLYGPVAFAFSPDSSQVYVVTESATSPATITVIDANSHAVTSTINVAKSFQGKEQPSALAANDKYIFVKTVMGPVMLLVFDASTHALAWSDANPSPYFSLDISAGLALTAKRLYYGGINAVMTLDSQTLAHLNTTYVQIDEAGFDHFVAAPDDSRTFLAQPANGVSTFPGSDWVNPTHLPFKFGGFYPPGSSQYVFLACRGLAVTSDCRQVFALRVDQNNLANCGVQVAEFDPGSGVYVAGAALLQGEAMPVAIAMTPDNSRLFVGSLASIAVLDASYA